MNSALEPAFPGIRWSGHWIAPEAPGDGGDGAPTFGGDVPHRGFSRTYYRRTLTLDEVPHAVPARLTADSRYILVVNGTEVGRGPIRSQPRRLRYDSYDLAPHLTIGENTIAVLVSYYGTSTSWWQPAVSTGGLGTDALLVFEARLADEMLVSDEQWRVLRSSAYSVAPAAGELDGVPVEIVDARELPLGWDRAGFDDSTWSPATVVSTSHIGGFAQSRPPTDPYGRLLERGIGMLVDEMREPHVVFDVSSVPSPAPTAHPADAVRESLASIDSFTPGALPATSNLTTSKALHVGIDFGGITAGYVEVDIQGPAGTVIELYFREYPWSFAGADEGYSSPRGGAHYVLRGHGDEFRAIELHGMRYLHLVVRGEGDITVQGVRIRESHYPWSGEASFSSDVPELDRLYRAGIRTVQMNSFDAFTDCPTREQRAWVGDGVVHQLVHLTTNADWQLARNYVTLSDSPRSDGLLPMSVVGEIEANGSVTIPDWSLHWIHAVHNLFRYTGDREAILASLPTAERILRWYESYVDEHGTISDVPEWNLVDWASVFTTHRSSILTALWARGLKEFAEISEWMGNSANAEWARGLWDSAVRGFDDFWDEARGTYIDNIVDGERRPAASQAAGATAIVSGLAPRDRWSRIIDTITDDDTLVVRSWVGGDGGGYDTKKAQDQMQGVQRIDWDAEHEIVLAEPFFSYVVHDAVAAAGQANKLTRLLTRWSSFLVDGYDTFGENWGFGTPVHGWSSTPARDLVQYTLGVTPAEPGFTVVRIAPALGEATRAEGVVPTPFGPVSVWITEGRIEVDSPIPAKVVSPDGREQRVDAGRSVVVVG